MRVGLAMLMTAALMSAPAAGQDQDQPDPIDIDPPSPIEFQLTAGVWLPRLGGHTTLGPSGTSSIEVEHQWDLDNMEATFNGELLVSGVGDFSFFASGFDFSTDTHGTFSGYGSFGSIDLNDGDPFRASVDMTSVGVEAMWRVYQPLAMPAGQLKEHDTALGFDLLFGARWVEVEQTVESLTGAGGRESPGDDWFIPYAGVRMHLCYRPGGSLRFIRHFDLDASGAAGTSIDGDGGLTWQVRAGANLFFTENISFMFGYRLLELDVEDGDYQFDAGLQGLFLGGSLIF